jgi:outer membrane lipoprotein carrier protein
MATAMVVMLCSSTSAQAGPGGDHLRAFLDGLNTLQASFRQILLDEQGVADDESSGQMYLSRPGRFRWDYLQPNPMLIVADGNQIWLYDKDLEQVTVRAQALTLNNTPAALLASTAPIADSFEVSELGEREDGSIWLSLRPHAEDSSFEGIRVGFAGDGALQAMELKDSFGQTTRLLFSQIQRNPELDEELFKFSPPTDVDVIEAQ